MVFIVFFITSQLHSGSRLGGLLPPIWRPRNVLIGNISYNVKIWCLLGRPPNEK